MSYARHFSERNIPFGIASSDKHQELQVATRIGDNVFFLYDMARHGLFSSVQGLDIDILKNSTLNHLATSPKKVHITIREIIQEIYKSKGLNGFPKESYEDISSTTLHMCLNIGDFIDYSCSLEHVKNTGRIVTKSDRVPPGFFNFPIGYHGRSGSIYVSGTDIKRPAGQYYGTKIRENGEKEVVFGPSQALDYEVELGVVIGTSTKPGERVRAVDADEHIFGFVLVNDWSARDIQGLEMPPLGPFNGKSFGTSISPWVITHEALKPLMVKGVPKMKPTFDYLADPDEWTYAIQMQVEILTEGTNATLVGSSQVSTMYWTPRQMVAHAVSGGGPLRTGDILATGTVSEPGTDRRGCLLETTEGGVQPLRLADGSSRTYLKDSDSVRITGVAGSSSSGIGFGECIGRVTKCNLVS